MLQIIVGIIAFFFIWLFSFIIYNGFVDTNKANNEAEIEKNKLERNSFCLEHLPTDSLKIEYLKKFSN